MIKTVSTAVAGLLVAATLVSAPLGAQAAPDDLTPPTLDTSVSAAAHPLTVPPDSSKDTSGPNAATGDASLQGIVNSEYNGGERTNGIVVDMYRFDADHNVTFHASDVTHQILTSNSIGMWGITGLDNGDYWIRYTDRTDPAHPTVQWQGSTPTNPAGTALRVTDTGPFNTGYTVRRTGGISGIVSCEGCSAAPAPADVEMILAVPTEGKPNGWTTVDRERAAADGTYSWPYLLPGRYMVFALYSGTGPYSAQSNSDATDVAADSTSTADVLIAHLITPLDGVRPAINSNVNALYSDFLNRLPSAPEASGWANLLQNLHVPRTAVADGFVGSDEYRLIRIDAAYQSILGRAAEESGRQFWLANMKAGLITTDDIETSLYASAEYLANHGGTNVSFAKALYSALLHRDGGPSDWEFWGALADQNGRDWVIKQFWDEPETIGERVTLMYEKYLGRVPDAGGLQSWVNVALAIGDSGLRAGLTGSDEYYLRSQHRFQES